MLKKCLKYDLLSFSRLFLLLAGTVLGLSPIAGLLLRLLITRWEEMLFPWEAFLVIAYVFLIGIFILASILMVYIRYYTHLFRDEGYLTFTLPVKRSTLLFSKILSAMIYQAAAIAVVALAVCIVFLITPYNGQPYHTLFGAAFTPLLRRIGAAFAENWFVTLLKGAVGILLAILIMLFYHLFYYLTITMGSSINRKHPLLFCVLLIYAFNTVLSLLSTPALMVLTLWFTAVDKLYPLALVGAQAEAVYLTIAFTLAAMLALLCAAIWQWILHLLERRLNLA
ncbi:MAG: hypothetical protein E7639_06855 [Ruminococcaceae bacterium]|nr:hypothetical protein [Oscillospiraceae bacterium]